ALVEVKDKNGNAVTGLSSSEVVVSWSPRSPGNAYNATPAAETSQGVYRIECRNMRLVGSYQGTALVRSSVVSGPAPVSITVGAPFLITQPVLTGPVSADTGTAIANFNISDAYGNPIIGASPTATVSGGNPEAAVSVSTVGDGQYRLSLSNLHRATTSGANWAVRAALGSLQSNVTNFTVSAGNPAATTLSLSPTTVVATTGTSNATVTVKDQRGNEVVGLVAADFTLAWTPSAPGTAVTFTATSPSAGTYTLALSALRTAGSYELKVTARGTSTSSGASLTVTPGVPATITSPVLTTPINADAGTSLATFRVRDAHGNGIAGLNPTFAVTGGNPEAAAAPAVDKGGGDYEVALSNLFRSTLAGAQWRAQATVGSVSSLQVSFTVVAGAPASATVALSAASVTADAGAFQATVAVRDQRDNPVTGLVAADFALQLAPAPTGGFTQANAVSVTPSGSYRIDVSALRAAGAYTATARVRTSIVTPGAPITVTAGNPASITAPALSGALNADAATGRAAFRVLDAWGNGVAGRTPAVTVSGGNSEAAASAPVDNGNGDYHADLSNLFQATSSGAAWQVRASIGTVNSPQTPFTLAAGAPSLATTVVDGAATGTVGSSALVTVQVRDQRNNVLGAGTQVTLVAKEVSTGGDLTACSVATQPAFVSTSGRYEGQVGSSAAQACTFHAYFGTADTAFTTDTHTVTFAAP
ncbi:MAG: hypothetical protein ACK4N5_11280, partial [Myxococcales bacterium]